MPTITIPDDTYAKLVEQANALGVSPDQIALPAIERATLDFEQTSTATSPDESPLTGAAWVEKFQAFNQIIEQEASRYPEGFHLDDSREAMYEGCRE